MSAGDSVDERRQLGKYQIVEHIATGGMGAVYKALVPETGHIVALKVLSKEMAARPIMRERLRREAAHGAKLSHDHIVEVIEFGEFEGTYFLAMEYVPGKNMQEYIDRRGKLAPDLAEYLLKQIVSALDQVHQHGLIHRDIKPSNILLMRKEGRPIAKLADLGLIRETSDEEFRLTREGYTVGTVDYLAPEQARDSSLADIRSDIYSLGCTFYQMLTGSAPFPEGTLPERLFKHAEIEPPDVRNANPKIPAKLAAICRRMLAKKPEQRYQTPADLLAELTDDDKVSTDMLAEAAAVAATPAARVKRPAATPAQKAAAAQYVVAQKRLDAGDVRASLPLLFECCRLDPAQATYRQALREALHQGAPGAPGWWHRLQAGYQRLRLQAAKKLGDPLQVLERGERVLAVYPRDLTTHLQLAEAALTCRFPDLARWLLQQAANEHGPHPRLHRAQAMYWEKQGDVKQAIYFWELITGVDPDNAEARHHLKNLSARETMSRGKYQENIETRMLE